MATVLRSYAGTDLTKLQGSDDKLSGSVSLEPVPSLGAPIEEKKRGFFLWRRNRRDPDAIATQPSVFDDPATLEVYRPPPVYESAHRFDPFARWTWREEIVSTPFATLIKLADVLQPLVRKIDLYIMIWAWIMFFALDLDRANISQANTDNFLVDLGMTTNDFNTGNMLFKVSPSALCARK